MLVIILLNLSFAFFRTDQVQNVGLTRASPAWNWPAASSRVELTRVHRLEQVPGALHQHVPRVPLGVSLTSLYQDLYEEQLETERIFDWLSKQVELTFWKPRKPNHSDFLKVFADQFGKDASIFKR